MMLGLVTKQSEVSLLVLAVLPLLLGLVVNDDVRLVHNLRLDNLLDDILQSDQTNGLQVGVALSLIVGGLHYGHVPLVPGLELIEHVREDCVIVDKVRIVPVELTNLLHSLFIICVKEEKIFGEKNVHNICPLSIIDWDPRVTLTFDL